MSKKTYYWLKLKNDFFIQPKIKKLRRIAGGDTYTLIYLKLQLLSLQHEGVLLFDGVEDSFVEELALTIDETVENVQVTVQYLISQGLLEEVSADSMLLPETVKSIGSETRQAGYMRNRREAQKEQSVTMLPDVTKSCTEIEIEIDTELEQELEIDTDSKHIGDFASPDSADGENSTVEAQSSATSSPHRSANDNCNTTNNIVKKSTKPECGYAENFETLWKLYPYKQGKSAVSTKAKKALLNAGYDVVATAIKYYVDGKPDWLHYMYGSTFFNGRWEDYKNGYPKEETGQPQASNSRPQYKQFDFSERTKYDD